MTLTDSIMAECCEIYERRTQQSQTTATFLVYFAFCVKSGPFTQGFRDKIIELTTRSAV